MKFRCVRDKLFSRPITQGLGDFILDHQNQIYLRALQISQITDIALLPIYLTHDNALLRHAAEIAYERITEDSSNET